MKIFEDIMMKYTDLNITVCELFADTFTFKYKIKKPLVVKNVPEVYEYIKEDIIRNKLKLKESDKIVIYLGSMFPGRGVEKIIETSTNLEDNIKLVLIGPTKDEYYRKMLINKSNNQKNLIYLGTIMPDEVYGYLHSADIGIVYYENSFFANNSLSNKIFDYMMAGLPTIAIAMSETKRIIEEVNFGKCYEEIEPRELAMLINRMANDKNLLNNYRKNAINFSQNKYNWKLESKKLINAIDMITTVPLKVE